MGICYNRLWKLMIDRKLKKKDLRERANISTASMAKLANDEYLSLDVLVRVCNALGVEFSDIMEIVPNSPDANGEK
ncbi:MAG: helix-turn-helix transcriptional regulator [Clostridiales bacterium]|nr:helix-turn-helix transcriptional regulator [Clostridiales bacterium]